MSKLVAILQIKSKSYSDFYIWLKWYLYFIKCDRIYIIDESTYDITKIISLFDTDKIVFIKRENLLIKNVIGFNTQQNTVNTVLELAELDKDDIVILPDDDEFWWYDKTKYESFKDCAIDYRKELSSNAILVPWTLMRSKDIMQSRSRNSNFAEVFQYRSNISNCEHKPILFYNGPIDTSAHCGYKNCKSITSQINTYFSECRYDLPLRCYHFRFTTVEEFVLKQSEDISCHNKARSYMNKNFAKQIFNGQNQNSNYDIKDITVLETLHSL